MKKTIFLLTLLFVSFFSKAQGWERTYTNENISFSGMNSTKDGGALLVGNDISNGDLVIVKIDFKGRVLWRKNYNLLGPYTPYSIAITKGINNSGFLILTYNPLNNALIRIDEDGNKQWTKYIEYFGSLRTGKNEYFISGNKNNSTAHEIIKIDDSGNVLSTIGTEKLNAFEVDNDGFIGIVDPNFLIRISFNGTQVSRKAISSLSFTNLSIINKSTNGNYYVNIGNSIVKTNKLGDILWSKNYDNLDRSDLSPATKDGLIFLTPKIDKLIITRLDDKGTIIWSKNLALTNPEEGFTIIEHQDSHIIGLVEKPNRTPRVLKIDANGELNFITLKGRVVVDANNNCLLDIGDKPSSIFRVEAVDAFNDRYLATTDAQGFYTMPIDTGKYDIFISNPYALTYRAPCTPSVAKTFSFQKKVDSVDFVIKKTADLPFLTVTASTPFLRRCFDNIYTINYGSSKCFC
jgi:hypothetical protein